MHPLPAIGSDPGLANARVDHGRDNASDDDTSDDDTSDDDTSDDESSNDETSNNEASDRASQDDGTPDADTPIDATADNSTDNSTADGDGDGDGKDRTSTSPGGQPRRTPGAPESSCPPAPPDSTSAAGADRATSTPAPAPLSNAPSPSVSVRPPQPSAALSGRARTAAAPADLLDLTDWYLTLPTGRPGDPDTVTQPDLRTYTSEYFQLTDARDGVVFTAPVDGVTTKHSSYPRTELREMRGPNKAAWSNISGTHTLTVAAAVTALPAAKPETVAAQIHDGHDDVLQIRLEGAQLVVQYDDGAQQVVLDPHYRLGTRFETRIVAADSRVTVFYNGDQKADLPLAGSGWYFKAGAYAQSNPTKGDTANAVGQVVVYCLAATHSDTAPAPPTPAAPAPTTPELAPPAPAAPGNELDRQGPSMGGSGNAGSASDDSSEHQSGKGRSAQRHSHDDDSDSDDSSGGSSSSGSSGGFSSDGLSSGSSSGGSSDTSSQPSQQSSPSVVGSPGGTSQAGPVTLSGGVVQWRGDFDAGNTSQWDLETARDYSLRILDGGAGHTTSGRFEVRDGDTPVDSGERSEAKPPDWTDVSDGDERWYSFSMMFDTSFPVPADGWCDPMQWHPANADHSAAEGSPPLNLQCGNNGDDRLYLQVGDKDLLPIGTFDRGVWHHYLLHVKFSNNPGVAFEEVLRDGQVVLPKTSPRYANMTTSKLYLKIGMYRKETNNGAMVVWHDDMTVYTSGPTLSGTATPATTPSTSPGQYLPAGQPDDVLLSGFVNGG